MAYIDLNMVSAGVVNHPLEWLSSGFREIQNPPERYSLINRASLKELYGVDDEKILQTTYKQIAERALVDFPVREPQWSESIAVGGGQLYLNELYFR